MRNIWTIAKRELYSYFGSPVAYGLMAAFLAMQGIFFFLVLAYSRNQYPMEISDVLGSGYLYFFLIIYAGAITMRLLSEEQRSGTLEIILTAPVRDWELIVGKYLSSLIVFAITLVVSLYQVAILAAVGEPDWGTTLSAYLGFLLVGGGLLAIGTLASTVTRSQAIAVILSIAIGVVLWLLQYMAGPWLQTSSAWRDIYEKAAFFTHYDDFIAGLISTEHVVYYISWIAASLFLATQTLQARRWR
ncbi:MAG: ABC transporter permease subunit [Anaerolineae bacterium]|nr:ABC transporter permease subunit [Anaerolineae bacterium]